MADLLWTREVTLADIEAIAIDAQQGGSCQFRVTVLRESSTDSHAVKLMAVTLAEEWKKGWAERPMPATIYGP